MLLYLKNTIHSHYNVQTAKAPESGLADFVIFRTLNYLKSEHILSFM
jgi:hypothetical protein